MSIAFAATIDPPDDLVDAIAALTPANPFHTGAFVRARARAGGAPVALTLRGDTGLASACIGFLSGTRPFRSLEIPSIGSFPDGAHSRLFFDELAARCRAMGVCQLDISSFASDAAELPPLSGECSRRQRQEYVLDMDTGLPRLSSNHRRNVSRARASGITVRRTRELDALHAHLALMQASMTRRSARGEAVPSVQRDALAEAFLATGVGELFQAVADGASPLSSILVLRSPVGAYYHSAGTSPEGMDRGASQFLIASTAEQLRSEGVLRFNLGGAGPESEGLQRFKAGFGARVVPLEAATCVFGTTLERGARRIIAGALRLTTSALRSQHT